MKKSLAILLASLALLAGCGKKQDVPAPIYAAPPATLPQEQADTSSPHGEAVLPVDNGDIVEITEKLFIAQTNDIYINAEDYIGRTVKYEGIYKNTGEWSDGPDETIHFVIRYGPGCCGYDGEAGFEVRWNGGYPAVDDWVEVTGTIEEEDYEGGYKILYVSVTSLTVKEERGAEYVAT
jgi:putative membrane protein